MCSVTNTLYIEKLKSVLEFLIFVSIFKILFIFQFLKYSALLVLHGILFYKNFEMYTN